MAVLQRLVVGELPPRRFVQLILFPQLPGADQVFVFDMAGTIQDEASANVAVEVDFNATQNNIAVEGVVHELPRASCGHDAAL
jgi:hypothetical protein